MAIFRGEGIIVLKLHLIYDWTGNWTGMLRQLSRKDCGDHPGAVKNDAVEKSLKFLSFILRRFLLHLGSRLYRSPQ